MTDNHPLEACTEFDKATHDLYLKKVEDQYKVGISPKEIEGWLDGIADPKLIKHCLTETIIKFETTHVWCDPTSLDGRGHNWKWYLKPSDNSPRWESYVAKLQAKGHIDTQTLAALDASTTRILNFCPNPNRPSFQSRGLVMGHVQSGKTTNFIGLLTKAADENYRLIVVLSGITNNLRNQTQSRLIEMTNPGDWIMLTDKEHDFRQKTANAQSLASKMNVRMVAVIKKNKVRLDALYKWLDSMDAVTRKSLPVLIIDDESDQATTNSGTAEKRKAINNSLAKIMDPNFLPKVSYVGYTATPFANMLADATDLNSTYPRDFIVSLDKSPGYFGANELFGTEVVDEEEIEGGSDIIRSIPNSDVDKIAPPKRSKDVEDWTPIVPESLERAIDWFIIATATRRSRSGKTEWSSMMIHTSSNVQPHFKTVKAVKSYLDMLKGLNVSSFLERLENLWKSENQKAAHLEPDSLRNWEVIKLNLNAVLNEIKVIADNSKSTDRLDYDSEEDKAPVIAVGGNTLSRGLTLEGLVSTYFLRTSNAYDSLMQMGRWFGYRPGYSDLQRIWMSNEKPYRTKFWFRELAQVEQEIRDQIEVYALEGRSPSELGTRIKSLPGMAITARAKMQSAVIVQIGYGGTRQQTILFDSREAIQKKNIETLNEFVSDVATEVNWLDNGQGWPLARDVKSSVIKNFINGYEAHSDIRTLQRDLVNKYIDELNADGELDHWNVVIYSNKKTKAKSISLPASISVRLANRSRMAREENVNIKTLISLGDMVADKPELKLAAKTHSGKVSEATLREQRNLDPTIANRPLLGIYIIDKDSVPETNSDEREALNQHHNLVGYYIVFPETKSRKNVTYYGPNLSPEETDFEDIDDPYTEEVDEDESTPFSTSN